MTQLPVKLLFAREPRVDKFDQQILALLRADARLPVSQIAREINLSRSAVSERIRQLEQSGVISGYHAQVAMPGEAASAMRILAALLIVSGLVLMKLSSPA